MEEKLLIYEVQTDDTLTSIASGIGMTANELRDFHNAHCQKVGLLWFNGLTGIQKIVLPKNYKSKIHIQKELIEALPFEKLSSGFYSKSYHIVESYESDFENQVEIDYSLDVNLKKIEENSKKEFIASIRCYDFKKKDETPDDKISELSIQCMESISPIPFQISEQGKLLGVHEFPRILSSFEEKRNELQDYFVGEVAEKYMNKFAESLADSDYFEKQIRSTLLYQVLFPHNKWFQPQNDFKDVFYLVKNSFPLSCVFNVSFLHLNDEYIQTVIRGETDEKINLQDLLRGRKLEQESEEIFLGRIQLKYTTHKKTKHLVKAEGGIALFQDEFVYRKQKISITQPSKDN